MQTTLILGKHRRLVPIEKIILMIGSKPAKSKQLSSVGALHTSSVYPTTLTPSFSLSYSRSFLLTSPQSTNLPRPCAGGWSRIFKLIFIFINLCSRTARTRVEHGRKTGPKITAEDSFKFKSRQHNSATAHQAQHTANAKRREQLLSA